MKKIILLFALFVLALAGLTAHYTIHPVMESGSFRGTFFLATLFSFIDVVLVTALFLSKKTALYGYLLNGFIAIFGTVFMVHFDIAAFTARSASPAQLILNPIMVAIIVTWADFFAGRSLYNLYIGRK